jgi:SAM-dependent methyltransferase
MEEWLKKKEILNNLDCSLEWKKCLENSLLLCYPNKIIVNKKFLDFFIEKQSMKKKNKLRLRYFMYQLIYESLLSIETNNKRIITFGGDSIIRHFFDNSTTFKSNYPEYDLINLSNVKEKYDVVIADQVLEHVKKPWLVAKELHSILNKNGIIIITTVFMYKKHNHPGDYFRFTTDGLEILFEDYFEKLNTGGYGNDSSIQIDLEFEALETRTFTKEDLLSNNKLLNNMEDRYSLVWYIGRKI